MDKNNPIDWDVFLLPYAQALTEVKAKLKGLRREYIQNETHSPIEFIMGRVKTPEVRHIAMGNIAVEMEDIAGLRIICQFVEDIYEVVKLLRKRHDFTIIAERDYIAHKKASGYRSYHLVVNYPLQTVQGEKPVQIEIQIRTLAMNFWATIEHSLNYKYPENYPEALHQRLIRAAEAAFQLDEEMSAIKEDIKDAQRDFNK